MDVGAIGGIDELAGKTIRGYELRELIGSGGFAAVYMAYQAFQTNVGRDVAIKIILPRFANNADFIRRFEYEAQIVARLEHPYIVPLFDFWREPNAAYLVMRWLQGGSLASLLRKGPIDPYRIARYLDQLAPALDYAHKRGIVHRDLKPGNVLLDTDDNAYLADFGIAKDTVNPGNITEAGVVIGSPSYFSPEQVEGKEVGASADIYSLGIVLYELLTGHLPFPSNSIAELVYKHVHEPLPLLNQYIRGLPERLDMVLQSATAKSPTARFPTATALALAFRQALGGTITTTVLNAQAQTEALFSAVESTSIERVQHWSLTTPTTPDNPYKGLRPFSENDAEDFFGRQSLVEKLIRRMTEPEWGGRFLAVVGPSGSGKSSAVKAGLIPILRTGAITNSDKWFIAEMVPGSNPYEELERALLKVAVSPPSDMVSQLQRDSSGLINIVAKVLPDTDADAELLLVIDQFEELFTLLDDEPTRHSFLSLLYKSVTTTQSRLRVIITLRADFFDKPLHYQQFGELIRQRNEVVLPLNTQELNLAILGPAQRVGLVIGPELVDAMMHDVGEQAGALPLLQFALTELYERRQGNLLSLNAYLQSGGVLGALARRADDIYSGLNDASREASRQLFLRLVTLGEGTEDTRRRVKLKELLSSTQSNDAVEDVIDTFSRFRLLTLDRDDESREPTIEVAHEALIRSWTRLREWLNESRDELKIHRRLTQAAADWANAKQETSYLASGARLEQFEQWRQTSTLNLSEQENTYLNASLEERMRLKALDEARRKEERRVAKMAQNFQRAAVILGIVGVLALAIMLISLVQGSQARAEVASAQSTLTPMAAQMAAADVRLDSILTLIDAERALIRPGADAQQGLLLGIRSLKLNYSQEADELVVKAIDLGKNQRVLVAGLAGVFQAAYSPDGARIAIGTYFQQLWILDARTGSVLRKFEEHDSSIQTLAWSADSKYIATGTMGDVVRIWNAETGELIHEMPGHSEDITSVKFSPDGTLLLSTAADGTARLWDTASGQEISHVAEWEVSVTGGAFSPDGKRVVLCGADGGWQVWSIANAKAIKQLESVEVYYGLEFNSPAFSPDGRYFLLGGSDGSVRTFDTYTGREVLNLSATEEPLFTAAWSRDGRYIAAGGQDQNVYVWDMMAGGALRTLSGHNGFVSSMSFSPDGAYLVTTGNDRTVRSWTLTAPLDVRDLKGNQAEIYTLAVSRDGRYLASGGNDRTVRLYDLSTGQQIRYFSRLATSDEAAFAQGGLPTAHADSVTSVQFSMDGQYLLSAATDGFVRLWRISDGALISELTYPNGEAVYSAIYAGDGRSFFTTSSDATIRMWNVDSMEEIRTLGTVEGATYGLVVSADGKLIASGGEDINIRLWNAETGEPIRTIPNINLETGEGEPVYGLAMTPDGKFVFAAGPKPTARMYDAQTGTLIREFVGHTQNVQSLVVSHDGKLLLSASQDGTVRLWDVETGSEIRRYLGLTDAVSVAVFSPDEKRVLAGSWAREIRVWDTTVNDLIAYACSVTYRDFTTEERASFGINDTEPTCPQFGAQATLMPATTTPLPDYQPPVWTPVNTPTIAPSGTPPPTETPLPTETLNGIFMTFTPAPAVRANPQGVEVTATP